MAISICKKNLLLTICVCAVLLVVSCAILPVMSFPGGLKEVSAAHNDVEAQDLAKFAVSQHNSRQNSDLEYEGIVSAHKQVVAGVMYHFKLKAATGGKVGIYEAKVWVKPWENFKSLEHFQKVDSSVTPADLGHHLDGSGRLGLRPVSSNDPAVKEAAKEALKSIQGRSNSLVPYELEEVVSAHAEVNDESTRLNILLKTKRGSKEEQFKAEVSRTPAGAWTVKDVRPHHQEHDVE